MAKALVAGSARARSYDSSEKVQFIALQAVLDFWQGKFGWAEMAVPVVSLNVFEHLLVQNQLKGTYVVIFLCAS